jgi:gliding motility-associated-like protein
MWRTLLVTGILSARALAGISQADFALNKGQWPDPVAFRSTLPSGTLWVESQALTYQFFDPSIIECLHPGKETETNNPIYREHSYRVHFEGSLRPDISGQDKRTYYHNYYCGASPENWVSKADVYAICLLRGIYPSADLKVYSHAGNIKYDFLLHPGSNPESIRLRFDGGVNLALENEELVVTTSVNEIREKKPFAYQVINGRIVEVTCAYRLENHTVSFDLGHYDRRYDLILDPEIAFSSYIGSTASNFGFTACNDSHDHLLSGAAVFASNYPVTVGAFEANFNTAQGNYIDIAISKFSDDGSQLLYSTYLGGNRQETPHSIVCDSDDNFILMGVTGSANFPVSQGAYQTDFSGGPPLPMSGFFTSGHPEGCDFFVSKFLEDGSLNASTYAGGPGNDGLNYADQLFYNYGDAFRGEVNVDANNNIYIASVARGDFPMTGQMPQPTYGGGDSDGIILRFNPSLSNLTWGTYIGGSAADACYAIEFASDGTLIVAGGTRSVNFPYSVNGADPSFAAQTDGFIIRIHPATLNVLSGTFVGTNQYDQVYFVQTDQSGNIYALGQTAGTMAISPGLYGQSNSGQFIRKFNNTLSTELWTTTIGTGSGEIDISPTAFLVSDCGQIYFSGWGGETNSTTCQSVYNCYATFSTTDGLPVTDNAFQSTTDGSDFYICVLSPDATELVYASFLGGTESNEHVDGGTSRFDKGGAVYQAVCAGCQGNSDFPTTPGAWSSSNPSFGCNLAVFRFNLGQVGAQLQIDGPSEICEGQPVQFLNLSNGANEFEWSFGDGITSTSFEPDHIFEQNGTFTVTLIATDNLECLEPDTAVIDITVLPGVNPVILPVEPICPGESIQLVAIGSPNLTWVPHPALSDPSVSDPIATPSETTTFFATDYNDCDTDTVGIIVQLYDLITGISDDITICSGQSTALSANGGIQYIWFPPEGLSASTGANVVAGPGETTTYTVAITTPEECETTEAVTVTVVNNLPGGNVYDPLTICLGSQALLVAEDALTWSWSPSSSLTQPFSQSTAASPSDTTVYTVQMTNVCGIGSSQITVNVITPGVEVFGGGTICKGQFVGAWATGAETFFWNPPAFAFPPNSPETQLSPPESMAFTVSGTDSSGCAAQDSVWVFVLPLPEVDAGPDQKYNFPGSAVLSGNAFGFDFTWSPASNLSCTECLTPRADPEAPSWYYLEVVDHNGCLNSDSVFVRPYFPLWVPNTITPNNDGINDVFLATGINIEGFHLEIYDRWGNQIFIADDINDPWNGGLNGYFVQNDVYIWTIEYDALEGRKKLVGHVNVIR